MPMYPEYDFEGAYSEKFPSAKYPTKSLQSEASLKKQTQMANDYRANLPRLQQDQARYFQDEAKQNLASGLKDVKRDFNRRGMLNSGKRIGAEEGTKASSRVGLASKIYQNNQMLEDQASGLEGSAITAGYNVANANPNLGGMAASTAGNAYNQLASSMANNQIWGQIAGAGMQGLGYYLGSQQPNTNYNPGGGTPTGNYGDMGKVGGATGRGY